MFRINASEVAALVGLNPFKDQNEAIQDCWNRNMKGLPPLEIMRARKVCAKNKEVDKAYDQMIKDIKKTENNTDVIQKKQEFSDNIKRIMTSKIDEKIMKTKCDFEQDVMYAESERDKRAIQREMNAKMNELEKERTNALREARDVEKVAISKFNTNFGTRKETNIGKTYEEITGMNVEKTNKRHTWDIVPGKVEVVGRFDGFAEDGTLVEIKQRVRRLFGEVREYENVQVHVYMKMANVTSAQLVEKYEDQLMVHDILYDDDFMIRIECELEDVVKNYFTTDK